MFFKPHHYLKTKNNSSISLLPTFSNAVIFFKTSGVGKCAKSASVQILIEDVDVNVILPTSGCYCKGLFIGLQELKSKTDCCLVMQKTLTIADFYSLHSLKRSHNKQSSLFQCHQTGICVYNLSTASLEIRKRHSLLHVPSV